MHGKNPKYNCIPAQDIKPQSLSAAATTAGTAINEPWKRCRWILFLMNLGAFAASVSGRLQIQGLKRSDGTTWESHPLGDGTGVIEVLATKLDDAGAGENALLLGQLDVERLDSTTYKSIRIVWVNESANAALVSVCHIEMDLKEHPPTAFTDEFDGQQDA